MTRLLRGGSVSREVMAAVSVTFLSVPQGVAYALIAGLPPAMGLYAAALPAVVGSLLRSSRHVVTGPSNALSLLVGGLATLQLGLSPVEAAATLALLVGGMQVLAGALRLGLVVDYISSPVVLGYISGAGVLIGVGQLHHLTRTEGPGGQLMTTLLGWGEVLGQFHGPTLAVGLGTLGLVVALRLVAPKLPAAILAMVSGIVANHFLGLQAMGVRVIGDLSPVPAGLPPFTLPSLDLAPALLPLAIAATVLSLVESSAVARSIASKTGQPIDASREFFGQGMANVTAALFGGYPVSGSLARSAVNHAAGARTRFAGALSGVGMLGVLLLLGPVVDGTPIASLAGLLLVIAWDLVDIGRIRRVLDTRKADALALVSTMVGCWVMTLDKAIYLGVGISLLLFLRQARLLVVRELVVGESGRLREWQEEGGQRRPSRCSQVRILHVEGSMFFGASGELRDALDRHSEQPGVKVLVVRLKRARGLDFTTAEVLASLAESMEARGQTLLLVGLRPPALGVIRRSGVAERVGEQHIFPTRPTWFLAMRTAVRAALEEVGEDHEANCPIQHFSHSRAHAHRPSTPSGEREE